MSFPPTAPSLSLPSRVLLALARLRGYRPHRADWVAGWAWAGEALGGDVALATAAIVAAVVLIQMGREIPAEAV